MEKIFVTCCGDCPFYDEEADHCVVSGGLYLDLDVETKRYEIPSSCPLKRGPVAIFTEEK